jgi:hypothetical protein
MIGSFRWFVASQWIHIPHLSKPESLRAAIDRSPLSD